MLRRVRFVCNNSDESLSLFSVKWLRAGDCGVRATAAAVRSVGRSLARVAPRTRATRAPLVSAARPFAQCARAHAPPAAARRDLRACCIRFPHSAAATR